MIYHSVAIDINTVAKIKEQIIAVKNILICNPNSSKGYVLLALARECGYRNENR